MARQAVNGGRDVPPEFRDYQYNDEVGEAVLALLEGRDMAEALKQYRKREFIPRHMTLWLSDWHKDDERPVEERVLPPVPSAEDEAVGRIVLGEKIKVKWKPNRKMSVGSTKSRTQPSRRRAQDGRSWQKHAA